MQVSLFNPSEADVFDVRFEDQFHVPPRIVVVLPKFAPRSVNGMIAIRPSRALIDSLLERATRSGDLNENSSRSLRAVEDPVVMRLLPEAQRAEIGGIRIRTGRSVPMWILAEPAPGTPDGAALFSVNQFDSRGRLRGGSRVVYKYRAAP